MALDFNHSLANALLATLASELPASSVLEIRTGAPPGAEEAAAGTLLVSFTLGANPWLTPASSVLDIDANLGPENAVATGVAGHYRLRNAAGTRIIEGTVGLSGSGADLILQNTSINSGQAVTITDFPLSIP